MIMREWVPVSVVSYELGTDTYGQKRKLGSTARTCQMVIKPYTKANIDNVKYVDVTDIGLTADHEITDANTINYGGASYQVLYVIPSGRLYQIFMKRV